MLGWINAGLARADQSVGMPGSYGFAEIGMWYYKARMYSPTLGRFMQTDPIGYADGMNWYAYVGNDPVNKVDPLGLSCGTIVGNELFACAPRPDPNSIDCGDGGCRGLFSLGAGSPFGGGGGGGGGAPSRPGGAEGAEGEEPGFLDDLGQCLIDAGSTGGQALVDPIGVTATALTGVAGAVIPTARENSSFRNGRIQTSGRNPIVGPGAGRNLPVGTLLRRAGGRLFTSTLVGAAATFVAGSIVGGVQSENCAKLFE